VRFVLEPSGFDGDHQEVSQAKVSMLSLKGQGLLREDTAKEAKVEAKALAEANKKEACGRPPTCLLGPKPSNGCNETGTSG
jgi:hypothetical protein